MGELARLEVLVDDERGGVAAGAELKHNNLALLNRSGRGLSCEVAHIDR